MSLGPRAPWGVDKQQQRLRARGSFFWVPIATPEAEVISYLSQLQSAREGPVPWASTKPVLAWLT